MKCCYHCGGEIKHGQGYFPATKEKSGKHSDPENCIFALKSRNAKLEAVREDAEKCAEEVPVFMDGGVERKALVSPVFIHNLRKALAACDEERGTDGP